LSKAKYGHEKNHRETPVVDAPSMNFIDFDLLLAYYVM